MSVPHLFLLSRFNCKDYQPPPPPPPPPPLDDPPPLDPELEPGAVDALEIAPVSESPREAAKPLPIAVLANAPE
jgi:hypothetical protein